MAWLSRLPKRRVVSGLDLDDDAPPAQAQTARALDLTLEADDSQPSTTRRKRLRKRLVEEKENVIFEPERHSEGCPGSAPSREEICISERSPQDVEQVTPRRLLRHSISEESVIFPDRSDEPGGLLAGRRRLRQSISEESLIFPERPPEVELQGLQTAQDLEFPDTATSGLARSRQARPTAPLRRPEQCRAARQMVPDLEEPRSSTVQPESSASRPRNFASLELEDGDVLPHRSTPRSSPRRSSPRRSSPRPIEVLESQPDPPDMQEISEESDPEFPSGPRPPADARLRRPEYRPFGSRAVPLPRRGGLEAQTDERLARLLQEREAAFAFNRTWNMRALELLSQEAARAAQANALAALARPAPRPARPGRPARGPGGAGPWRQLEGRELTADDYETLLQLDSAGPSVPSDALAVEIQRLISMLPCSKLPTGATSRECMICLDQMEAGHEVRTLPCMHVFHSECIDKWLRTSERRPICPIDKEEVQVD